jgi:hypothetical protein
MKKNIFISLMALLVFSGFQCKKETYESGCIRGRLEIRGICMNYVIKVLSGDIDPALTEANWQDPSTGIAYQNVFALGSPCSFPASLNEGDEFYFRVVDSDAKGCAVCQAYRPVPAKKLQISVTGDDCE